jgi:4-carboxymuconolactone decarboxylase
MIKKLSIAGVAVGIALGSPALAAKDPALDASPPGCTDATSSAQEKAAAGKRIVEALLAPRPGTPPLPPPEPATFGRELGRLSTENVFANLWGRCGLSRRDRSLVTLGILIALRAEDELRFHFPIAIRNGLTRRELEEVVYQASGYAGFPAAAKAQDVADETLGDK